MDISTVDHASDKENFAPASSEVYYPELPRLSPSKRPLPATSTNSPPKKRNVGANPHDWAQHIPAVSSPSSLLRSPPNTGRRRAPKLMSTLAKSPPRPSYADKVKGIFAEAPPVPKTKVSFPNSERQDVGMSLLLFKPSPGQDSNSSSGRSLLTAESELERRLQDTLICSNGSGSNIVFKAPKGTVKDDMAITPPPDKTLTRPYVRSKVSGQQDPCQQGEESSDAWTDDDEFYPSPARRDDRRIQQQREMTRLHEPARTYAPSPRIHETASGYREPGEFVAETPVLSSRSSRFRPAVTPFAPRHMHASPRLEDRDDASRPVQQSGQEIKQPTNYRSSDADDEADTDPDA